MWECLLPSCKCWVKIWVNKLMFSTFDHRKAEEKYQNQKSVKFEGLINSVLPLLNDMGTSSWVALSDPLGLSSACNLSKFSISCTYRLWRHSKILKDPSGKIQKNRGFYLLKANGFCAGNRKPRDSAKDVAAAGRATTVITVHTWVTFCHCDTGLHSNIPPFSTEASWLILAGLSLFHLC